MSTPGETSDRIAGRIEASEMLLAFATGHSDAWLQGFFRELHRQAIESGYIKLPPASLRTIDDTESRSFEARAIAFGIHTGTPYKEIPIGYLTWLADSATELQAYLRSTVGRERIESE